MYVLVPLPLERQIQDLLAGHRVEEALTLTEGAQRNIPKDKFQVHCLNVHCYVVNISCLSKVLACFLDKDCWLMLVFTFQILHKRILQQAGFIQFGQLQFSEAKEHFR